MIEQTGDSPLEEVGPELTPCEGEELLAFEIKSGRQPLGVAALTEAVGAPGATWRNQFLSVIENPNSLSSADHKGSIAKLKVHTPTPFPSCDPDNRTTA